MPSLVNEFGNVLPEITSAKKHPASKFKSGSYLDDDSLEVGNKIKRPDNNAEKKVTASKGSKTKANKNVKEGKLKTRTLSTIEKMYHSLRQSNVEKDFDRYSSYDGPQVSINVGGKIPHTLESIEDSMPDHPTSQTFDIATGNINHGNRSINYTVQEILGTCFAINLVVSVTQQSWMVFVPSSETVLELLRIWKIKNNPENMNKLCTWLLSCVTLEFDEMTIVAAHFNHSLFQKCYTQEMILCVQTAAIKVQSHIRRYLSNKRLRFSLLKAKQIQESRILASMRVKAARKNREQKTNPRNLKSLEPISTISTNTDVLVDVTQALLTPATLGSLGGTLGGKKKKRKGSPKRNRRSVDETVDLKTPRSPAGSQRANSVSANARRRKVTKGPESMDIDDRALLIEREVNTLKTDIGGTLNEFQSELQNLKTELAVQKQSQLYSRPNSSQYHGVGPIGSPPSSRNGVSASFSRGKTSSFGLSTEIEGNDVDSMKNQINSLLSKIGALEEDLTVQRTANERTQEIAKLEIMSAKLEAESAVERAAAKVRSETINEIAAQMREIEKERLRMEEEKMQRDLIREETMRRELEKKQQQMSDVLKQELFRQQLLQQQEQAALLQRQHELQEKLLQQQQQGKGASPAHGKTSPTAAAASSGGGVNQLTHGVEHVTLNDSGKQNMVNYAESVNLGGSSNSLDIGANKSKKTWNWLLFGGTGASNSSNSSKKPSVSQQAPPSAGFGAMSFETPIVPNNTGNLSTVMNQSPAVTNTVPVESVPQVQQQQQQSPSSQQPPKKSKRALKEEKRYYAAVTIQHAALRFIRRRRFARNANFGKIRAENLLTSIDHTKEEKVVDEAMALSMQYNHQALANKTLNRLYTLVVKYDKNEVLYPANYNTLVEFLLCFFEDVPLLKKGLDVLNIVLKINSEVFGAENTVVTDLLMKSVGVYEADPLICFKVTRCIYRMCEKNGDFRVSFGGMQTNMVTLRKLFEIYLKNPSIIENIMKCIINLCIDCVPNQDIFNQIGVCDCVFFAFMEHLKVERLFYLICRAMVNLCANNHYTNQTQLAKGIYPNIFIKAIMLYKANPRAIEQVITCVLSIVANHKINKGKFQDAGLCEVLLDLIRISDAYPSILTNCFWALSNLSNQSNPTRKIVHQKIIDTIKKFESESPDPELVRHAKIALNRIARTGSNNASRVATPIASVNVVGGNNFSNMGTPQLTSTMDADFNAAFAANVAGTNSNNNNNNNSNVGHRSNNSRSHQLDGPQGFSQSVISDLSV